LLLKRYAQTWSVSGFVQDRLQAQGTWANLRVSRHFINTDRFVPRPSVRSDMRRKLGVDDRFVVTVIAQLIPEKGVDVMLQALTQLPAKVVLWIVGTGRQAEELQALARQLGVEQRVTFFGLQRQVEPYLQATDCFVLPSRWQEAAGLVLLEAQATGVPVVASRTGGIPEYVAENRSGFLFEPEDARALARHVRVLCDDALLCRRMGQEARALVIDHFSPTAQLPIWLSLYRNFRVVGTAPDAPSGMPMRPNWSKAA
jgi:glycosyltransferase involved in cell wall biosynthesis